MFASENHITLQNPPFRPLGPDPTISLQQHHPRPGLQRLDVPSRPHPRVTTTDDHHVGIPIAVKGRSCATPRLLHPVTVRVCFMRQGVCQEEMDVPPQEAL